MRITAFVGAALLAMCSLALMPAAMAEPAPDVWVFDMLSGGEDVVALDAFDVSEPTCVAVDVVAAFPDTPDGDDDDGVDACVAGLLPTASSAYRLHVDPGRCSV